ncbi:Enoyl-CoA hydratase [Caballeronia sordidicola]|uniref:Enoyl-CoA hydratase n=1 Tax=Caballeronia sordidicola TaxID=196367 RepID=A0A242MWJ8_CABSO|nr:Enoyl-CoA hydratase [Caballeronia sordidicola]
MSDLSLYSQYTSLELRRHEHGVLEIIMNGAGANKSGLATADANTHRELADIWRDIDRDPDTRVALIRGEGKGFSGGGDLHLVEQMASDFDVRARVWREARDLVYNVINCSKPIVSAMHGPAVGAGGGGAARGYIDCRENGAHHRRSYAARRRRRRSRGDRVAVVVRHGEGEVLPAVVRTGERRRGGADRAGIAGSG